MTSRSKNVITCRDQSRRDGWEWPRT